ncbi:uncharacterized protein GLRG_09565 [Colletotrichum graminicola M1.001]|uniref:Uncharacterized protein n=1 Tax=Colletotrichum graminicola (strain M1.001 / M2 / FGSC 10212) TaxID=645133 RepID=E3QU83_COLGM|nr:uncharacterized protein GLRG_09565 [Colletotrichum graminicola M1.001]EFQ34421.1 hypothetical protein GLRG_09565 [Colletotrichum graminicola M1.001]
MADSGSGSGSGTSASASDVITYIGVPLAVLGVLPILYNTVVTLAARSRIRRMLRHARLTALTRSDIVNRVIEVDLPRYAITPWDRFDHREQYWSLSRHPSSIPGGSWTVFNWRTNTIGLKTQRVEYADQLCLPQADINFEDLVSYLLDLGAVPDAHGWRLLRTTGLWTPVGCTLMHSPDGQHKALAIAPLNDSDGHLSLSVTWSSHWTTRSHRSLPPYWLRLPPPPEVPPTNPEPEPAGDAKEPSSRASSLSSISRAVDAVAKSPIACKLSSHGLIAAHSEVEGRPATPLHIDHVRVRPGLSAGVWFASAATAYGTSSTTVLWSYTIPDDVLRFARASSVPCGVLELLGLVDASQTPEWASSHDDMRDNLDLVSRRMREQRNAMAAESRMSPKDKEQAVRDRMRKEAEQRLDDLKDKMRLDVQRRDLRTHEAIQSPKWDAALVASHALPWLRQGGHLAPETAADPRAAAAALLHRMLRDGAFAAQTRRRARRLEGLGRQRRDAQGRPRRAPRGARALCAREPARRRHSGCGHRGRGRAERGFAGVPGHVATGEVRLVGGLYVY